MRNDGALIVVPTPLSRSAALALATLCLVLVVLEAGSYLAARFLDRYALFYEPRGTEGYEKYLRVRDPLLGWSQGTEPGASELDTRGARIVPSFPDPSASQSCVAVFGDSFTYGAEVSATDSYANRLALALDCRVSNFGVPGYGTDQALLRYRALSDEHADFVVLGHYPEDIVRNVNQFRDLHSQSEFGLKPRFLLEADGTLRLVPLPTMTADEFSRIPDEHERILPYEFFRPGGDAGIVTLRFPYTWSLLSVLGQYRVQAALGGYPSYAPFYDANHPSGALELTIAILTTFAGEARARGEAPLVLLIPDVVDLEALRHGASLPYAPLERALRDRGVAVLDAGVGFVAALGEREACVLYTACSRGHLNAEGSSVLARSVAARLRSLAPAGYRFATSAGGGSR